MLSGSQLGGKRTANSTPYLKKGKTRRVGGTAEKESDLQPFRNRKGRPVPFHKRITGTRILVDAFQYASEQWDTYFLTHFHSDHYTTLSSNFRHGKIYCSPITARLVTLRLRVPSEFVVAVPLDQTVCVAGVSVTLLDANHCPGAVLLLFCVHGNYSLHTGDMRYHPGMQDYPLLQGIRLQEVYLDTTYCDPKHVFPTQEETMAYVVAAVRDELLKGDEVLFVFGTYTIGKEKILYAVAQQFRVRIYCSPSKLEVLRTYGLENFEEMFTCDPLASRFHAVGMNQLALPELKQFKDLYEGRYERVVGFRPTGWTGKRAFPKVLGHCTLYSVPYSEHSSFPELRAFVQAFPAARVIPTVNVHKSKQQVSLLTKQTSIKAFLVPGRAARAPSSPTQVEAGVGKESHESGREGNAQLVRSRQFPQHSSAVRDGASLCGAAGLAAHRYGFTQSTKTWIRTAVGGSGHGDATDSSHTLVAGQRWLPDDISPWDVELAGRPIRKNSLESWLHSASRGGTTSDHSTSELVVNNLETSAVDMWDWDILDSDTDEDVDADSLVDVTSPAAPVASSSMHDYPQIPPRISSAAVIDLTNSPDS